MIHPSGLILPGEPQFEPRASGAIVVEGIEVAHTKQCVHCNGHFVSVKGSGARRGFCMNCQGTTCGALACDPCVPFEKKLKAMERA